MEIDLENFFLLMLEKVFAINVLTLMLPTQLLFSILNIKAI